MTSSTTNNIDPRRLEFASDRYRPAYHYLPPANWMNDPNGTIYWKGQYHLFYQYNPNGDFQGTAHWGHSVSDDLVHWRDLPIALAPAPDGPDHRGCWSGGAVVNDGVPTLIYHGNPHGNCIATSHDDLLTWEKHPANPVLPKPAEDAEYRIYDPCTWREGNMFYSLSGSHMGNPRGIGTSRDVAFIFRSPDMVQWEYLGKLYEPGEESDCAVPDFFPLGNKHMLLFASHTTGAQYYLGTYANQKFTPQQHGRMNYTTFEGVGMRDSGDLIAPISWEDGDGRRIMIAWVAEGRTSEVQRASGWAGVMSLPRILSLGADDTLRIEPAPNLQVLRRDHQEFSDINLAADAPLCLEQVQGESLELVAVLEETGEEELGLKVRCCPDDAEQTQVLYHPKRACLTLDVSRSSISADVNRESQTGPLQLRPGEPLELHIFIDRSIVEVFANSRQCLTKRIYPDRPDSLGIGLLIRGGSAKLRSMDVWQIDPVWPTKE